MVAKGHRINAIEAPTTVENTAAEKVSNKAGIKLKTIPNHPQPASKASLKRSAG